MIKRYWVEKRVPMNLRSRERCLINRVNLFILFSSFLIKFGMANINWCFFFFPFSLFLMSSLLVIITRGSLVQWWASSVLLFFFVPFGLLEATNFERWLACTYALVYTTVWCNYSKSANRRAERNWNDSILNIRLILIF